MNPKETHEDHDEEHLSCPAYPNCDIDPNGCCKQTDEPEPYGHRD